MYIQCGSCPKCGAPLWMPNVWHAVTPPPVTYSCRCFAQARAKAYSNSWGTEEVPRNVTSPIKEE